MESIILIIFVCSLLVCVIAKISILYALVLGYLLFAMYASKKGFTFKEILKMSFEGIMTAKNILITFMLIGIITALWRACGTIPAIVCYSVRIMNPGLFVITAFLLNCLVSFLTGTAFGTAATMGSICMTIAYTMNLNPVMLGGAVLSGAYFGDRCSPVSTSALLVAEITKTNIYKNIRNMFKTALVPFAVSCLIYLIYGIVVPAGGATVSEVYNLFTDEFYINFFALIPAIIMLVLSLIKVNAKITMLTSIIASAILCFSIQKLSLFEVLKTSVFGFNASKEALAKMIDGGGIVSMLRVAAIVCISSCYSGIFRKTGLLDNIKEIISGAKGRFSSYAVVLITSVIDNMVACNQTLAIMLTHQLCSHIESDKEKMAIYLENSAVVVAPLVPWSIACTVSLNTAGAPMLSVTTAFFLFLLPLCELIASRKRN